MWSKPPAAAGNHDPTTLFEESTSTSSTSLSSVAGSNEDHRTLQELLGAASGLLAAPSVPWARPHHHKAHKAAALTEEEREAQAVRRQQQRARREHHFFKERGAVDFQRSAVFEVVEPGSRKRKTQIGGGGGVAEAEVWTQSSRPSSPPQDERTGCGNPNGDCVPVRLQAWYVASNAAPSTTSSPQQQHEMEPLRDQRPAIPPGTRDARAASSTETEAVPTPHRVYTEAEGVPASALAAVAPAVRSSGAGTTSVNMLWSRVVPDAEARQTLAATPTPGKAAREHDAPKEKKRKKAGAAAHITASPLQSPFRNSREAAHAAHAETTSSTPLSVDDDGGSSSCSNYNAKKDGLGRPAHPNVLVGDSGAVGAPGGNRHVLTAEYADGGRPPLRAHRYVEQPNGVFVDHARHADLMAEYALAEQLRYAQEKEDTRRIRRWNRLLHGTGGDPREDGQQKDPGMGGQGAVAAGGNNSSAAAAAHARHHWLYDAATYRKVCLSVLCYLQRVHVFLVGLAAGVSLLTLVAITVPFPELEAGHVEDGLPSHMAAFLLLAVINTTATVPALPTAHVLPVLQQGHSALALFMALLQPYHASLLLCLCMLLVITGLSPVPWGIAERHCALQRRKWLAYDEAERHEASVAAWRARVAGPGGSTREDHPPMDNAHEGEGGEFSGGAGTYSMLQSPFTRTLNSAFLSTHRSGATLSGHRGSSHHPDFEGTQARSGMKPRPSCRPHRHNSVLLPPISFNAPQQQDPRLSMSLGGGAGGCTYDGLTLPRHYGGDTLRNSISLGLTRSAGAHVGPHSPLGASLSGPPYRAARSASAADLLTRFHDGGAPLPEAAVAASWGNGSAAELFSSSYLSSRNGGGGGFRSGSATLTGLGGWSPPARATDAPPPLRYGSGASSVSSRVDGVGRSPRSMANPSGRLLRPRQPLLLVPVTALEGQLSTGNVFSRTAEYAERHTMQWICNTLRYIAKFHGGSGNEEEDHERDVVGGHRYADAAGAAPPAPSNPYREGHHHTQSMRPAVPVSLYLHVLLQPRLWCIIVALALTLVELALVDECSVELMWLAQPSSWWSTPSSSSALPADALQRLLPHRWMEATLSYTSDELDAPPLNSTLSHLLPYGSNGGDKSGHVGRVLLAVYATRMAMIWVAFLLLLFF
ncbi:hypothetical protein ABL78_7474 [Leptomonas seymouri]|uniref:Uncharacterized protein n=1 Tax=Leptomonas seymouri TaxID=5684 RepID=A0A0N0P3B9_LEPSE|nr:hypothetical protein ABL78_7474 [Leptomonas seymouri]|eukprot:KPI83487.1 hypothetical protein ABL78_7474 [Leptomonas seymouri]